MLYGCTNALPVGHENNQTYNISQCNNMFIFPGLGFGASTAGAKYVSDDTLFACSEALAHSLTDEEIARGQVFPNVDRIREVSCEVAEAVVRNVIKEGHCRLSQDKIDRLGQFLERKMYNLVYVSLV